MDNDIERVEFYMGLDDELDKLVKKYPNTPKVLELRKRIESKVNKEFYRSTYQGLHELTIEKIIRQQAEGFYKDFPSSIKEELILSFIEMEHHRRRDNYWGFCMYLFKTIECYVNVLFENGNLFNQIIQDRRHLISGKKIQEFVLNYYGYNNDKYDNEFENDFKIDEKYLKSRDFQVKFRVILALLFFGKNNKGDYNFNKYSFNEKSFLFYEIQQVRNIIHGGKFSNIYKKMSLNEVLDSQENKLIDSYNNRFVNYLRYQGFLAEFMQKVHANHNKSNI